MTEAYPLYWPDGWPRTPWDKRRHLQSAHNRPGWDRSVRRIFEEIRRMGVTHPVLSTNQPLRRDGLPYATPRRIDDPGAALYFTRDDRQLVMAQDRFVHIDDNIRSLALAIEGMRQMERHGGATMMDKAFSGFAALPPPSRPWFQVLEISPVSSLPVAEAAYRALAKSRHPDAGGTAEAMAELNEAWENAKAEIG